MTYKALQTEKQCNYTIKHTHPPLKRLICGLYGDFNFLTEKSQNYLTKKIEYAIITSSKFSIVLFSDKKGKTNEKQVPENPFNSRISVYDWNYNLVICFNQYSRCIQQDYKGK